MTLDGVACALELEHLGVRSTMGRLAGGMGLLVLGAASVPVFAVNGWFTAAAAGIGVVIVVIAAFSTSMGSEMVATPRSLRIGRVERPRSAWGRFEIVEGSELVLTHHLPTGGREWWSVSKAHAERLAWFVEQVQAVPVQEQGSEEAVPAGLKQMVGRKEPE